MTTRNQSWSDRIEPVTGFPKMPVLVSALVRLARDLGPGTRLPRTRELAQALGVTVVTLNQGLSHLERRGFLDRRPRSGIYVSPNVAQKNVGLVIGWDIFSERHDSATFYTLLLACCARRAALNQERFSFFLDAPAPAGTFPHKAVTSSSSSPLVHQDLADALTAGRLDGLLLTSPHGPEQEEWLRSHEIPVVNLSLSARPGTVSVDSEALIHIAAQELMRGGVRSIGLVSSHVLELRHFHNAAATLGFETAGDWIVHHEPLNFPGMTLDEMGRRSITAILPARTAKEPPIQGIIVGNDLLARGVIQGMEAAGLRPGRDIRIATHSNKGSHVLAPWHDCITQCQVDPQEIADTLFTLLEISMDSKDARPPEVIRTASMPDGLRPASDGVWRILPHVVRPSTDASQK